MKLLFLLLLAGICTQQSIQSRPHTERPLTTWTSSQIASSGSYEAKFRDKGWYWVMTPGEIERKSYVQDILEGRLNQPEGRGAIGKVISVVTAEDGQLAAIVDFGLGYSVGIFLKELALVEIVHD